MSAYASEQEGEGVSDGSGAIGTDESVDGDSYDRR